MQCVVFTDSNRLAAKYRASQQDICKLLQYNLNNQESIEFLTLDAVDYQEELGINPTWKEYKAIVTDFIAGMGLTPSPKLALFIVGGDDVIPMPRITNPINEEETLQADMLYCFKGDDLDCLNAQNAICNIGRLPLESGSLPSKLNDDLQSYFNLSNMVLDSGIDVNKVVMTTTESWLPASNDMVRGLPVKEPPRIADATNGNLYVSPRLATDDIYVIKHYQKDIAQADLLMFNLHGSDARGYSSFYGEGLKGHNTPEAFSCEMLRHSGARIINTLACFGGRYTGYNRKDSMLMSALYGGGVLLYAGSCTSALGRTGRTHHVAQDALMPSGYSESFMKLYTLYLFKGITAGEAFLTAKCDYYNLCHSLDGEDRALATVLMFNLFGIPVLSVNQNKDVIQEARGFKEVKPVNINKNYSYRKIETNNKMSSGSILEQVRTAVDRNLKLIQNTVESKLYNYWGLNPRDLINIDEVSTNSASEGYRFEYLTESDVIEKRTWAYVDKAGNIKDVLHFK